MGTTIASAASGAAVLTPFLPSSLAGWALLLKDAASALAVVVGGTWAYWHFVLQREGRAKIEFNVELNRVGVQGEHLIVEAVALINNKGQVRHRVREFHFDLHYLKNSDDLQIGDKRINYQLFFKNSAVVKRPWIPEDWYATFVDPGVTQRYTYVIHLPTDASFALLHAHFRYPGSENEIHTVQRAFCLRQAEAEPLQSEGAGDA